MELTKKEALNWHKQMWIWIAKEIARNKTVMDISVLKRKYCFLHAVYPQSSCFCCEYVRYRKTVDDKKRYKDYVLEDDCEKCPVVWGNDKDLQCTSAEYERIFHCTKWKGQVRLAYKIAMLPEREEDV